MPQPAGQPRFKVTRQHHEKTYSSDGQQGSQWHVHFESQPSGTESHITLPDEFYTAANVHNEIAAKSQEIEAVHALDGTPPPPTPGAPGQ